MHSHALACTRMHSHALACRRAFPDHPSYSTLTCLVVYLLPQSMRQTLVAHCTTLNLPYSADDATRCRSPRSGSIVILVYHVCCAAGFTVYIVLCLPGFTALGLAINKGDHAIVALLLKCHASLSDIVAERDTDTPLEYALNRTGAGDRRGAVKVAIQLIQAGEWGS